LRRGRSASVALTVVATLVLLAGCAAGVNEDLAATATPRISPPTASPAARLILGSRDRALAALTVDDPEAELIRLDGAAADRPDDAETRALRGLVRFRLGDLAGAEEDITAALAADPGLVAGYVGRGLLAVAAAQGRVEGYTAALQDFNRALTLDSGTASARLGQAWALIDRARHHGESVDWERALAEAQDERLVGEPLAGVFIAHAYLGLGDERQARQALERARSALDGDDSATRRAALLTAEAEIEQRGGNHDVAVELARAGVQADPWLWEAYRIEAASHLAAQRPGEARDALGPLLDRRPDDGRALLLRAAALASLGARDEAIVDLDRASASLAEAPAYSAAILQVSTQLGVPASPMPSPDVGTAAAAVWQHDPYRKSHALEN
jgi:tetratricopeptide (TPR) repeat protein